MQPDKPTTVVFYGHSGAGKGTQTRLLLEFLERNDPERKTHLVETGALIRSFFDTHQGYTSLHAKEAVARGELLPAFIPVHLWGQYLIDKLDADDHLIFDGIARTVQGAIMFDNALRFYERDSYRVFVLEVSDETAKERLQGRQRGDLKDDEAGIQKRIELYHSEVETALVQLEQLGKKAERVDGEGTIEQVHANILSQLGFDTRV